MTVTKTIPYRSTFLSKEAAEAWKYFQKAGYPDSKNENWRFSNPTPWLNLNGERISSDNNLEEELWPSIKSFLIFLKRIPEYPKSDITGIPPDNICLQELESL